MQRQQCSPERAQAKALGDRLNAQGTSIVNRTHDACGDVCAAVGWMDRRMDGMGWVHDDSGSDSLAVRHTHTPAV